MRFRVAIVSLLAAGLALSGGGVGLAVSGLVSQNSPATVQYGPTTTPTTPKGEVLGGSTTGGTNPTGSRSPEQGVRAPRQVAEQGSSALPFTGWATIPIMLVGFALLGTGLVLRRRTRAD
jgi:hypothetical protein